MRRRAFLRAWLPGLCATSALLKTPLGWAQAVAPGAAGSTIVARFGTVPPPSQLHKVFAAGPPAGVLAAALVPDRLVGWPMPLSDAARALLSPTLAALPHVGRLAGRGSTMPLERLLQLQPDLVLDAGTADATYVSGAQRVSAQTGLPTVLVQGRIEDHAAQLRALGALLGVEARAAQLAHDAESALSLAAQVRASVPASRRLRVYYGRGVDGLETGLDGSINVEVIACAGGRNVAAAAGRGSLTRVSLEQILAWDPEVIVTQDPDFARRVLTDPLWRSLPAVRNNRVLCAPTLPFGWLDGPPGINRLIGVRWLVAQLYPDHAAVQQLGPLPEAVRAFYRLFYGAELSDAQIAQLLGHAA